MQQVHPLELETGKTYYLEYPIYDATRMNEYYKNAKKEFSFRAKGKFVGYIEKTNGNRVMTYAAFEDIRSVNKKPLYESVFSMTSKYFQIHVAPNKCAYNIYKSIKGLWEKTAEEIVNTQNINMNVPIFTIGSMTSISGDMPSYTRSAVSKGNWKDYASDRIYYDRRYKTNVGKDLSKRIAEYIGGKTRKSRRSQKSKSRKHQFR